LSSCISVVSSCGGGAGRGDGCVGGLGSRD